MCELRRPGLGLNTRPSSRGSPKNSILCGSTKKTVERPAVHKSRRETERKERIRKKGSKRDDGDTDKGNKKLF